MLLGAAVRSRLRQQQQQLWQRWQQRWQQQQTLSVHARRGAARQPLRLGGSAAAPAGHCQGRAQWFARLLGSSAAGQWRAPWAARRLSGASGGKMSAGSPTVPAVHRLSDYKPLAYRATHVELDVELDDVTKVVSRVKYVRSENEGSAELVLDGEPKFANMTLQRVALDGRELARGSFSVGPSSLRIPAQLLSGSFTLEIAVTVEPAVNTSLSGLYRSGAMLLTQMEAEGMRNLTYFVDRPDNMATYTTRLEGDKARFPVLLSNGEDVARGDLPHDRHYVVWKDPFPKPSYLFAIVAGDLAVRRDSFVSRPSGKVVQLAIWVDKGDESKTEWAMRCIKMAMEWDQSRFDREYDLGQFNIVGTKDFNMGAMENTSLNIFNSRSLLAERNSQSDADFQRIEAIIGHEFFHHWTGNRVTCRDWHQLTLKEGLTVLRDQLFTSDLNSPVAKRIEDVKFMYGTLLASRTALRSCALTLALPRSLLFAWCRFSSQA
jgi:aminopeptidase N